MPEQQEPEYTQALAPSGCDPEPIPDPLISNLDPNRLPNLRVLTGFLTKSPRIDDQQRPWWRLYLTLEMNNYVDIPPSAVVCSKFLGTDQNPLAGTLMMVRRDANLLQTRVTQIGPKDDIEGGCNVPPVLCALQVTTCSCGLGSHCACLPN
jgi:hypothetical protein